MDFSSLRIFLVFHLIPYSVTCLNLYFVFCEYLWSQKVMQHNLFDLYCIWRHMHICTHIPVPMEYTKLI